MTAHVVRVGELGKALTALTPSGAVELADGRRLDARSDGAAIPIGAAVVVLRGDPTGYVVREIGPNNPVPNLPDTGAEIVRAEFQRNSADVRRAAARDREDARRAWVKDARGRALAAGALGAAAGLADAALARLDLLWGAAGGLLTGLAVALVVGRCGYTLRWSPLAAAAAIGGGLAGAEIGFWAAVTGDAGAAVGVGIGALCGVIAGGWAGRNLTPLAGPGV